MIRVCHITSVHSWDDTRIFHKECCSIAASGYDTVLLVANGIDDVVNGVKVVNVPIENKGRIQRIAFAGKKILDKAIDLNADIYHLHDPELLRIAVKLKKQTGAKVVFDAHEDLPKQIMDKNWIPHFLRNIISKIAYHYELKITSKLDGVISVTETICERFKTANKNVAFVANFPRIDEMTALSPDEEVVKVENSVCYVGALFPTRGIKELVTAIGKTNATLFLAGKFSEKEFEEEVRSLAGWKQVRFLGYLDREGIVEVLQQSQIGMVTLHPTRSYKESLPIKLFEYMLAKLPIISSDFEYWKPLVLGNNCGVMVNPLDTDEIAEKINYLLNNPELCKEFGENGYRAVMANYSWESQSKNLLALYSNLTTTP
jgi:glycosyltransferase involved in cell wall biosynthesis